MTARIVFVTDFPDAADAARDMVPPEFDFVVTPARSPEYIEAMRSAEYLVGFVDMLVDDDLFAAAPNLKLVQLLSAGYDKANIEAARKAGIHIPHLCYNPALCLAPSSSILPETPLENIRTLMEYGQTYGRRFLGDV